MKHCIVTLFITVFSIAADQTAITDNGIKVILKEDGTWQRTDSIGGSISPFATTDDSQAVYLDDDGTWEHFNISNTFNGIWGQTWKLETTASLSIPVITERLRRSYNSVFRHMLTA